MIRNFCKNDLPEVLKLENQSHLFPWSEAIYEQCIRSGCKGWVLEEEGIIQGVILVILQGNECHILNLMIHPDFRHRGLGYLLLARALNQAKNNNIGIAYLEVRRSNLPAINLYKKSDFVEIGMRKNYYQTKNGQEDAIIFAKDLGIN